MIRSLVDCIYTILDDYHLQPTRDSDDSAIYFTHRDAVSERLFPATCIIAKNYITLSVILDVIENVNLKDVLLYYAIDDHVSVVNPLVVYHRDLDIRKRDLSTTAELFIQDMLIDTAVDLTILSEQRELDQNTYVPHSTK